jgi:spoIIIJ-associated protein
MPSVSIDEQAAIVEEFLKGLLDAFGLEGDVTTRVEGDVIYTNLSGDQTEALVGPKGAILDAVLELCRTMVHRQSQAGARLRLDIGGYGERRREALGIYAGRLAAKVLDEGGEVMLEPMNAADRKVVHDAVSEIEGVRTFSEGEEPGRSVVIARLDEDQGPAEDSGSVGDGAPAAE